MLQANCCQTELNQICTRIKNVYVRSFTRAIKIDIGVIRSWFFKEEVLALWKSKSSVMHHTRLQISYQFFVMFYSYPRHFLSNTAKIKFFVFQNDNGARIFETFQKVRVHKWVPTLILKTLRPSFQKMMNCLFIRLFIFEVSFSRVTPTGGFLARFKWEACLVAKLCDFNTSVIGKFSKYIASCEKRESYFFNSKYESEYYLAEQVLLCITVPTNALLSRHQLLRFDDMAQI